VTGKAEILTTSTIIFRLTPHPWNIDGKTSLEKKILTFVDFYTIKV